jgi:hypothetical protein
MTPIVLSERDDKINILNNVIDNRHKLLRDIYKNISTSTNENKYLKGIVNGYISYYENVKKQKESQIEHLNKLLSYITSIINNKKTNNILLSQARQDKNDIIREIKKIKREISHLTTNT